jgi:hypothetical protein
MYRQRLFTEDAVGLSDLLFSKQFIMDEGADYTNPVDKVLLLARFVLPQTKTVARWPLS